MKSKESFQTKLAIGAIGTKRVISDLAGQGHMPIELEKGSTSFKLWTEIKAKRLRVPDVLCVRCGTRVETRSKSKPEVSMSHSESDPERVWNYGLADSDYVAFVLCRQTGKLAVDWTASDLVQYISVKDLGEAKREGKAELSKVKGGEEGFERRYIWPSRFASRAGKVVEISGEKLRYRPADNHPKKISISLSKELPSEESLPLPALVQVGDDVAEGQILASVVPVVRRFSCRGDKDVSYYADLAKSTSRVDRFAAVRALAFTEPAESEVVLNSVVKNEKEEVLIRLEAAASLERLSPGLGMPAIKQFLGDSIQSVRFDAITSLASLEAAEAGRLLQDILFDKTQSPELRAAAAWGLGEIGDEKATSSLITAFDLSQHGIRVEAARALLSILRRHASEKAVLRSVLSDFKGGQRQKRAGIAWAIGRAQALSAQDVLDCLVDEDARQWVAYAIGMQDASRQITGIEELKTKDPEVYFAATVLWNLLSSWVADLEEY